MRMWEGGVRGTVCVDFGVGSMNDAGRDLIEWYEANELAMRTVL